MHVDSYGSAGYLFGDFLVGVTFVVCLSSLINMVSDERVFIFHFLAGISVLVQWALNYRKA